MSPYLFRALSLLLLLAAVARVEAAQMHCPQSSNLTERQVCADPLLTDLDRSLNHVYGVALAAVTPSSRPQLVQEQRDWIRYVRNVCPDEKCLLDTYRKRIATLQKNEKYLVDEAVCSIPDGDSCRSVVWYRDPAKRLDSFNASLRAKKIPGTLIGCSRLVDLPVGTARGNHSFGGICTMTHGDTRHIVTICNDSMIGHFAIDNTGGNPVTDKQLVEFTDKQCFGG